MRTGEQGCELNDNFRTVSLRYRREYRESTLVGQNESCVSFNPNQRRLCFDHEKDCLSAFPLASPDTLPPTWLGLYYRVLSRLPFMSIFLLNMFSSFFDGTNVSMQPLPETLLKCAFENT